MLVDPPREQPGPYAGDPSHDRTMLALQYLVAIVAVAAAGLLGFIH